MQLQKLEIKDFKGIRRLELDLTRATGPVFTLVGLNESGKTTILEAIDALKFDWDGVHALVLDDVIGEPVNAQIPKSKKTNFTGDIEISATFSVSSMDKQEICDAIEQSHGYIVEKDTLPSKLNYLRQFKFERSEFKKTLNIYNLNPEIRKSKRAKKIIKPTTEQWNQIAHEFRQRLPQISYFPSFYFAIPDKIRLRSVNDGSKEEIKNSYFIKIISNALNGLSIPIDLEKDILEKLDKWQDNGQSVSSAAWQTSETADTIENIWLQLSRKLTQEIVGLWNSILNINSENVRIEVKCLYDELSDGQVVPVLSFRIVDSESSYRIDERSTGFRWFFCFLLFTTYADSKTEKEVIFLFDEPAANLHSRAQEKILQHFEKLVERENRKIIFTTHSQYLINPLWLDNTFIVINGQIKDNSQLPNFVDGFTSTEITAINYKKFIQEYGDFQHYFQPILDSLEYTPSFVDTSRVALVVEGKSDFIILSLASLQWPDLFDFSVFPVLGAGKAAGLIGQLLGEGREFVVLLDGDNKGKIERSRYLEKFAIKPDRVICLDELDVEGVVEIEDLLCPDMLSAIWALNGGEPAKSSQKKKVILRVISEQFFGENNITLSSAFKERVQLLDSLVVSRLED